MIKKHQIGLFVDTSSTSTAAFKRIKKSTELTLAMNPETEDYDYIADENPTTELTSYKPEIEQPLKMIKGEDDFEYFWDLFYDMKVGEEAKTTAIVAFMFDCTETGTGTVVKHYAAWKVEATVVFNEMNANDSELNFNLNFGGTVSKGWVKLTEGVPTWEDTLPNS